ncbi:DoxX family protein [Haloglomus salinum]|jgi:putative oxidoreductase|uniref:DoxX family protein n=1 Tax=Haloglomus salinum TaxID=2962673 RepID=UPI0020C960DD|nr:DoxX family protein [Haloglomus salinum]
MSDLVLQAGPAVFDSAGAGEVFLLARLLFGGVLAFMGLNHFMNGGDMAGYAEMKGLPAPAFSVAATGAMLILGGLAVITGAYVVVGAGALALFLLVSAVVMHDFWTVEDPQQQQTEMTQFLKNVVMAGAALAFLALASTPWPYALDLGLV